MTQLSTKEAAQRADLTPGRIRQCAYMPGGIPYKIKAGVMLYNSKDIDAFIAFRKRKKLPVAKRLQTVRKKMGLSQEDMGKLLKASNGAICRWEAGNRSPRRNINKMLEALEKGVEGS